MHKHPYFIGLLLLFAGCQSAPPPTPVPTPTPPPSFVERTDDLIIVAGTRFHTGTPVVTWQDEHGLNAYIFHPSKQAGTENRGVRRQGSPQDQDTLVAPTEEWNLERLQTQIDQFVLHYDSEGFSHRTFAVLQRRGLSSHFLLDVDGTIYQTLDLSERAYHATIANSRSIGIEMANIGAYPPEEIKELHAWYTPDAQGQTVLQPPADAGKTGVSTEDFVARPDRPEPVRGRINGNELTQYDFTPEQYAALIKLTAALHRVFPLIRLDYPRDPEGRLLLEKLPDDALDRFQGVLGHFHIQHNKIDPGPAFQWERVIESARLEPTPEK